MKKPRALFEAAKKARQHSYSPYSKHRVGAAILTTDGRIYSGCNVENSSFGATTCAERVAIQNAISTQGQLEIAEVMVVTNSPSPWPPCGICRQVISEFGKDPWIHIANVKVQMKSYRLSEIFSQPFLLK